MKNILLILNSGDLNKDHKNHLGNITNIKIPISNTFYSRICFIEKTALEDIPRSGNWLTLAKLDGNSWSFARIEKMQVTKTAEKIRISEWASVGLYGFQPAEVFIEALDEFMLSNTGKIEAYIAPLYNFIKFEVYPHYIDMTEFNCAGTPSELNALIVKNKWNVEIYPEQFKD
jgi:hypothetical protein